MDEQKQVPPDGAAESAGQTETDARVLPTERENQVQENQAQEGAGGGGVAEVGASDASDSVGNSTSDSADGDGDAAGASVGTSTSDSASATESVSHSATDTSTSVDADTSDAPSVEAQSDATDTDSDAPSDTSDAPSAARAAPRVARAPSSQLFDAPPPPLPEHPDAHKVTRGADGVDGADAAGTPDEGADTFHADSAGPVSDRKEEGAVAGAGEEAGAGGKWKREYPYSRYNPPGSEEGDYSSSRFQDRDRGGMRSRGGNRRFRRRIDPSQFASMTISYKNSDLLRRFITDTGTILPRRVTGISAKDQRRVAREIKRARFLALLPMG